MSSVSQTFSARHEAQRAYLLLEHGELAAARRVLEYAITQQPDDTMLHVLRGATELAAGELVHALKLLRHVTRQWPEHPAAHVYVAEIHLLQRRISQSKRALKKARALCEPHPTGATWLTHIECLESLCQELDPDDIPEPLVSHEE